MYCKFISHPFLSIKCKPLTVTNGTVSCRDLTNHTASIVMAVFAAEDGHHDSSLEGLCEGSNTPAGDWAKDVSYLSLKLVISDCRGH